MTPIYLLIVEDVEDDALLMADTLRHAGLEVSYQMVSSVDGLRARLRERRPAAVISDYNMPSFRAEEALEVVREIDPDIPFILVSGMVDQERAAAMIAQGVRGFALKGDRPQLVRAVRRELAAAERRVERAIGDGWCHGLLDRFPDTVFRVRLDPEPVIEYVNPASVRLTGLTSGELCGPANRLLAAVEPDDRAAVESAWRAPSAEATVARWRRPDGVTVWAEQRLVGVHDAAGRLVAVEGVIRDLAADPPARPGPGPRS